MSEPNTNSGERDIVVILHFCVRYSLRVLTIGFCFKQYRHHRCHFCTNGKGSEVEVPVSSIIRMEGRLPVAAARRPSRRGLRIRFKVS